MYFRPMVPLAPARFSTITGWPSFFYSSDATRRPLRSPMPPAPAELTIYYLDSEVASLDESSLAIYAWNNDAGDWDYVGGTVDHVNHTVTANVSELRLYTVAPAMPAGRIVFTTRSVASGTLTDPKTTTTFTSAPLTTNNHQAVPDGALFTIQALAADSTTPVSLGTITTADEDPLTPGVQVRSRNGVISFQVELPGSAGAVRIIANAVRGTAFGNPTIVYP